MFHFCFDPNHLFHGLSHPIEGRLAIVTNARWDAVDAIGTTDERASIVDGEVVWFWRPDAGVKFLRSKLLGMTVATKPVTGKSAK
jgi:hypothetical protein